MYRIRLASGEEAVYRTAGELALAVRSGVLNPKSEVFHKAAGRWLPIEVHPDYRAVVTGKQQAVRTSGHHEVPALPLEPPPVPEPEVAPIELVPAIAFTASDAAPYLPDSVPPIETEYDPALDPTPVATEAPVFHGATRARKLRVMLALAMGVGGLCLVGGGAMLAGPPLARWLGSVRVPSGEVQEGMSPFDSMPPLPHAADGALAAEPVAPALGPARVASPAAPGMYSRAYPAPSAPLPLGPIPLANAEPTRVSRLPASRNAAPTYVEAYAEARAEMDEGFDYVQFRRVFAPSRFSGPDSIRAARRTVAAAGNIVRVYRGREVMLEQTFRPDDPGGRGSLRESFETAESARALLADVDSLFALLVAQQGRFSYVAGTLRFAEPRTAREYTEIRRRILLALADWRDARELASGATIPRLLQALGTGSPPPAR
ncbi:MAG: hypothetical protein IPI38_02205 [Gemmatimonadetes bacterium]|nr:hypothetical protein [Gemmatimonadota bacterium]MBK7714236.1 hypothetical protein [Gemmatimonadota bacterium]MBK7783300.1 hypothetical protein [Gemmatimonadota bacterium]MBK9068651.1 hypothetical protein [Gemmatimonadota bacterium]